MAKSGTKAVFLVPAAGRGARFGSDRPKAFVRMAGRPLVAWTVDALCRCPEVDRVAVAVPAGCARELGSALGPEARAKLVACVDGGATRRESVLCALRAVPDPGPYVGVHDGVRPFVSDELVLRVVEAARRHGAAAPCVQCEDTVKVAASDGFVERTVDRSRLVRVQTPQVFATDLLRDALERASEAPDSSWDEAGAVEAAGHRVKLVQGDPTNAKLTWPGQAAVFEMMLGCRARTDTPQARSAVRVGVGFDAHRFSPGRPLWLGGVEVDHPEGLEGHSDADVLCHAVGDAVLSACGLGDIGVHFPSTDPASAGMSGVALLARAAELISRRGWSVASVDAVVICERPRIEPHRQAMEERMAAALGIEPAAVTVKGTTTEGMGFTGRREGIAAQAVALVFNRPV